MTVPLDDSAATSPGQAPEAGSEGQIAPEVTGAEEGGFSFDRISEITPEVLEAVQHPLARKALEALRDVQADYTRKTQNLSEQRRELEAERGLTGWLGELQTALNENPDQAARMLEGALTQMRGAQPPGPQSGAGMGGSDIVQTPVGSFSQDQLTDMWQSAEPTTQLLGHAMHQQQQIITGLQQQVKGLSDMLVARDSETKLADLRGRYGDFDQDAVIAAAQQYNLMHDLEAAYRIAHFDTAEQRAGKAALDRLAEKRRVSPPSSAGAGGSVTRKRAATAAEAIALTMEGK